MNKSKYKIMCLVLSLIWLPLKADELMKTIFLITEKSSFEEIIASKDPEVLKKYRFIGGYWECQASVAKLQYINDNIENLGRHVKGSREIWADLKDKHSRSELKMEFRHKADETLVSLTATNYAEKYKKCRNDKRALAHEFEAIEEKMQRDSYKTQ